MDILLGAAIGAMTGFLLSLPAIILESMRRVKNLPVLIDVNQMWGRKFTPGEVFVISLLLHLIIATLAGLIYVIFARNGWLFITNAPYELHSVLIYSLFAWAVAGLIIYPALGMGWFARREGEHVWFEMLVTHLLLGLFFWLGVSYYQPFFFS